MAPMNARCATLNVSASSANGRRWRRMLSVVRPVAILAALAFASLPALAESRFALVIGNGAYRAVPELVNPPNDARDVAEALKSLGFKVTLGVDLDQAEMQQAIAAFASSAAGADASLFYFAGHGLQFAGRNYLIPVDARLHSVADIEKRAIPLDDVLGALKKDSGIHLVFLDACRSNPFAGAGVTLPESGLARVGKLPGFFTAFATQPDNVAFDGAGRNSPFARALLGHVATPGLDISSMMIAVRNDVFASTGGQQVPADESLLTRQFYFAGNAATEESPETQLWRLAGGERDPNLLTAYLDRYPDGPHAADVRSLLAEAGKTAKRLSPAQGDVEELLWSLARSGRQARLAELYLARYPDGAHVEDAKALIASLHAAEETSSSPELTCERLATHPHDATASVNGVEMADLQRNARAAIAVCRQAAALHPEMAHYTALLARATAAAGMYDEAYALYRKAADANDTRAMVSLGLMLETGDHAPKDLKAAYALYEKAADRGSADGALDLAVALTKGKGIGIDIPRAYALLRKASDSGSPRATYNMAALNVNGVGGKPADALELFRRAGNEGFPEGYRAAAVLLDEGRGVPRNPEAAAEDLLRAVDSDAGEAIAELSAKTQTWSVETVKAMQMRLNAAGYYAGPIDGRSGPALAPALKQWRLLGPPQKS
jgi:TPR repeat protein